MLPSNQSSQWKTAILVSVSNKTRMKNWISILALYTCFHGRFWPICIFEMSWMAVSSLCCCSGWDSILPVVLDHVGFCAVKLLVRDCGLFQLSTTLSCVFKAVVKHKLGSLEQKESTQPLCHYLLEYCVWVCVCVCMHAQSFLYLIFFFSISSVISEWTNNKVEKHSSQLSVLPNNC